MFDTTADRVAAHTSDYGNERIRRQTEANVAYYARRAELIGQRLKELDAEWDIERVLEMGSSALTLTGLLMSVASSRRWLLLSLAVQGFSCSTRCRGGARRCRSSAAWASARQTRSTASATRSRRCAATSVF